MLRQLQVDFASGVTEDEAVLRLAQYGPNALATRPQVSALRILINQVKGPVVLLLGGAAALAGAFGDWTEAVAILLVLGINTLIGFVTELRAVRSMEALRRLGSRSSRVRRGGKVNIVPAEALVPGDIVLLDSGDIVTADLRLVEAANLCCDESTLTGESIPVDKTVAPVARNAVVADRTSMVHKGTAITRGTGLGVVVATGMATELGQITSLVIVAEPDASPLERKLERLTAQLVKVTVLLAGLVGLAGVAMGRDFGWRRHGQRYCPDDRGQHRSRRCRHPGRVAHRRDHGAGARHVAHGSTQRAGRTLGLPSRRSGLPPSSVPTRQAP